MRWPCVAARGVSRGAVREADGGGPPHRPDRLQRVPSGTRHRLGTPLLLILRLLGFLELFALTLGLVAHGIPPDARSGLGSRAGRDDPHGRVGPGDRGRTPSPATIPSWLRYHIGGRGESARRPAARSTARSTARERPVYRSAGRYHGIGTGLPARHSAVILMDNIQHGQTRAARRAKRHQT